jgi:hypothetical protein
MSICKRFTGKLAAAAVAVAGVVGMAGAQPTTVDMGVSFTVNVEEIAKIEIAKQNPLTEIELIAAGKEGADAVADTCGTLGIIRVTTNSDDWDVELSTMHGGKLRTKGEETGSGTFACPPGASTNPDPWRPGTCLDGGGNVVNEVELMNQGDMGTLTYKSTNTAAVTPGVLPGSATGIQDTVQLIVKIGVCMLGADLSTSAVPGAFYALGAPLNANYTTYAPVAISSANLKATRKVEEDGTVGSPTKQSFATLLGTAYTSATDVAYQIGGKTWANVLADVGFATPVKRLVNEGVEHFYINVGLNKDGAHQVYEHKSKNGTYTETLTFDLTANF